MAVLMAPVVAPPHGLRVASASYWLMRAPARAFRPLMMIIPSRSMPIPQLVRISDCKIAFKLFAFALKSV